MITQKLKIKCPTCKKIRAVSRTLIYLIRVGKCTGNCLSCSSIGNKKRLGIPHSTETKQKMHLAHLGKKKSLQHKINMSKARTGIKTNRIPKSAFKKGIYTEAMRKGSIAGARALALKKETSIEKKVYDYLTEQGVVFEKQYLINERFLVDVYIPAGNMVIEVDGKYWHSLSRVVKKDKAENAYLKKCGFDLIRLSEQEINTGVFKERLVS